MSNAFDTIATKKVPGAAKKAVATAVVTDEMKANIDTLVKNKAKLKELEAQQKDLEASLIAVIQPQLDELAYCGSFTKSVQVAGVVERITYVTMDKFSLPQDKESLEALKKLVGKLYDQMVSTKRTITVTEDAQTDDVVLAALVKTCEDLGRPLAEIFTVVDKTIAKDDLDRKQFELPKKKLAEFRTLAKQAKPSFK